MDTIPSSGPERIHVVTTRYCCRPWPICNVPGFPPNVGSCGLCGEVPTVINPFPGWS